ncbi:SDR family NAD(P)-dependent oxidoreductase [Streptosporangium subroseum]|uniref:SDR family NAD(P)-dependent oxidoreductase n=1 Tax=Streptosporangium subroseum TaxID=106412 RepID=UPI00308B91DB|nr:SDR family oxidoreductase [Streptosporangium subroseum]
MSSALIREIELSDHQVWESASVSDFTGKTALITGSTSGIGRGVADKLAGSGARVLITGRDLERGHSAVAEIRAAGGKADFIAADLHDAASAKALAAEAVALAGEVDILVNSAGIFILGPTAALTEADFDATYNINVKALYFLVAALAPPMAERGHGAIINITTAFAEKGAVGPAIYGSSKAAVGLLTKSWAAEFGPSGVRVNEVSPGAVLTEGTQRVFGEAVHDFPNGTPANRVGTPAEIAAAVVFLASDEASYIHGASIAVDGGMAI